MVPDASHLSFFIGKDMSYVFTVNEFLSSHARGYSKEKARNILATPKSGIKQGLKPTEVKMKIDVDEEPENGEDKSNQDPMDGYENLFLN